MYCIQATNNHDDKKDRALQGKFNDKESAPYGMNPYTGEIFDQRGYPAEWDSINGNSKDIESARAVVNDAAPDELRELMKADPMIQQIAETFDAEMVTN